MSSRASHGRPIAIAHGLDDREVLPHHARDLAAAAGRAGTTVEPWFVPGADHQEAVLLRPADYEAPAGRLLHLGARRWLASAPQYGRRCGLTPDWA